jgi:PPP family 3-phenylpropionic acid transporter
LALILLNFSCQRLRRSCCAIHLVHLYFGQRHQGKGQALYSSLGYGLGGMLGITIAVIIGSHWDGVRLFNGSNMLRRGFLIAYIWVGGKPK